MGIKIITDSTADLSQKTGNKISFVSLTVSFGTEEFTDKVTIDYKTFYEKLETSEFLPVTSQASPFAFEQLFRKIVENGDTAIVLTISSKLSGTYNSAVLAAAEFPGKVFVVDSKTVAIGIGILAEYALSLVDRGLSAEETVEKLLIKRDKIQLFAYLDTLEYLKKGGRISQTAAFAGGVLNIKPIVRLEDGEVKILARARGQRQGFSFLTKFIENAGGIDHSSPFLFGYTGTSDDELTKYLNENYELWLPSLSCAEYTPIGSVIGTHVGPGAVAVAFFKK